MRIQKPTGSGGRPSKGQDSVLWDEDRTPRRPSRQEAQSTTLAGRYELLSPVRLGKKQDDGEAFLDGVSWCLERWACRVGSDDDGGSGIGNSGGGGGGGRSGGRCRIGGRRLVGRCRPRTLGLGESRRVAEGRRWEEVLDDCVSYGMYGGPRGKHTNHALGRTRRLPGAPRFDGVL